MAIRIAVDAMGGDHAPSVVVEGAVRAAQYGPGTLSILLFGPEQTIRSELARYPNSETLPIHVIDAPDVISMGESPSTAVKNKTASSIHLGLGAHKQGKADVFISAGNTGAVMGAALFILGRQPNVARPSLIGFFPTTRSYAIGLDIGTNVDCKPEHLVQFAQMGTVYARCVMKRENPVVALINVGEEKGKGNDQVKAAYELLEKTPGINFRGNIEGRDILYHAADVLICDGFVGNTLLKFGESMATAFMDMVSQQMEQMGLGAGDKSKVVEILKGVQKRFNYEEYGGAPLLGVNGNVIIGHGSSSARAIERMIYAAAEYVEQHVTSSIAETLTV